MVSLHYVHPDLTTYANRVTRISGYTNHLIAGAVPALLVIFVGGYRKSIHVIHHGLLATIAGGFVMSHDKTFIALIIRSSLNNVITEALKNRVGKSQNFITNVGLSLRLSVFVPGRLRPDFLSRCQWDAAQHVCTGYV